MIPEKYNAVKQPALIILGLLLVTLGYKPFLMPNSIAPGGFTGVGQLCEALFGWRVGLVIIALNVPLFLLGLRSMGLKFTLLSLATTFALSMMLDWMPVGFVQNDIVLGTLFGGILSGAGFGLILRADSSTGGSDMLARIVCERISWLKVGVVMFMVDFLVVFASMFVFDPQKAMYAAIALFLQSRTTDIVIDGLNTAKAYIIISRESEKISQRVLTEMERGVTSLKGRGEYSRADMDVLLCVVYRFEAPRLKRIISECDKHAFVIATEATEALGEGFKAYK